MPLPSLPLSFHPLPSPPLSSLQEPQELSSAKEMFGGRLNSEFILERTGQTCLSELRQANYPSCGLRTVELQPEETFCGLMRWAWGCGCLGNRPPLPRRGKWGHTCT